jgi:uncharacterized DUF497 family protein
MAVRFDPAKNERSIQERGLSFELAGEFRVISFRKANAREVHIYEQETQDPSS